MSTEYDGLEPIEPDDALRLYLDHEETEDSKNTVQVHRYRLQYFVQWCEELGLSNLNDLTGRRLQEYRLWRKDHGQLVQISLNKLASRPACSSAPRPAGGAENSYLRSRRSLQGR